MHSNLSLNFFSSFFPTFFFFRGVTFPEYFVPVFTIAVSLCMESHVARFPLPDGIFLLVLCDYRLYQRLCTSIYDCCFSLYGESRRTFSPPGWYFSISTM